VPDSTADEPPTVLRETSKKAAQDDDAAKTTNEESPPSASPPVQQNGSSVPPAGRSLEGSLGIGQPNGNGIRQPPQGGLKQPPGASDPRARVASREPPPINVSVGPNGELIISSPDTEALDLFEEMVNELAPPRREYKVFYLKYASAFSVCLNLEEYFEIDKKKDNTNNRYPYYIFGYDDRSQSKEANRLSKRRQLKFIYDTDSNTILAHGADPTQLKIIEELVELYDRLEPADSRAARMTTVFTLKWSKAKVVGETVKDVYRDLLSSNDKALQQNDQQKNNKRAENVYITQFGGDDEGDPRGTQVKFKGKLSIGIDELSNTLVVSTEGENLMDNVETLIKSLDEAARPAMNRVEVMKVGGSMDARDVRKALARAFIEQQNRTQPQQGQQQPGQNGQQPNQNGQTPNQNGQNPQEQ
jgi:hypothetical protein